MNIIVRFYFIFWTRENTSYISNIYLNTTSTLEYLPNKWSDSSANRPLQNSSNKKSHQQIYSEHNRDLSLSSDSFGDKKISQSVLY